MGKDYTFHSFRPAGGGGSSSSRSGGGSGGGAAAATQSTPARSVSAGSGEMESGKVYVGKLPAGCTETMLKDSFGRSAALRRRRVQRVHISFSHASARRFGRIQWVNIRPRQSFAHIQFVDVVSARAAKNAAIKGSVVVGETQVAVEHACEKEGEGVARVSVSVSVSVSVGRGLCSATCARECNDT